MIDFLLFLIFSSSFFLILKLLDYINEIEFKYDFIFIGGISTGGEISLHLLREQLHSKVLGIFTIGSFLIESTILSKNGSTPLEISPSILMMHGISQSFFF